VPKTALMFLDPANLTNIQNGLDILEEIEKASLRMVTQPMVAFSREAGTIFGAEPDKPQDIAEDITREAMDTIGVSRIPARLFGTMDSKRARYIFHPACAVRQALLVDSKAEKGTLNTATLQVSQTCCEYGYLKSYAEWREMLSYDLPTRSRASPQ
jgi:hypothetical protein